MPDTWAFAGAHTPLTAPVHDGLRAWCKCAENAAHDFAWSTLGMHLPGQHEPVDLGYMRDDLVHGRRQFPCMQRGWARITSNTNENTAGLHALQEICFVCGH
jgi:hypothetical protein